MLKEKLKSANFWVALLSAVIMALRAFGIEMGGEEIETAVSGIASILLILGITVDTKNITAKLKSGVSVLSSDVVKNDGTSEKIDGTNDVVSDENGTNIIYQNSDDIEQKTIEQSGKTIK